jgi:hypothetical protein
MSHIRNSGTNILPMIIGVAASSAVAAWQFYLFAIFKDAQGGTHYLWRGLGASLLACVIGFFVFSVFPGHDKKVGLHITS